MMLLAVAEGTQFPFRVLIGAGDDMTAVVRADLAIAFTRSFLEEFESQTASGESAPTLSRVTDGRGFTACAGIAYVKRSYPFSAAYELAESLCRHAKSAGDRRVSSLVFWRQTSSAASSYESIVKDELSVGGHLLTMGAYRCGSRSGDQPPLEGLLSLQQAAEALPRRALRNLVTQMYDSPARTDAAYRRLSQVQTRKNMERLETALRSLTRSVDEPTPLWTADKRTPLVDALELKCLGSVSTLDGPTGPGNLSPFVEAGAAQ
jgi:hypothetical protein